MNLAQYLKNNINRLPLGVRFGQILAYLPYSFRPGLAQSYRKAKRDLLKSSDKNFSQHSFIFDNVKRVAVHAYENVPFYKMYYDKKCFSPYSMTNFSDIAKIPIINKALLKEYDVEYISHAEVGSSIVNTGGTSGTPFDFYVHSSAFGHEWAHIHYMWSKLGFSPSNLKLNFHGRSNIKNTIDYDLLRHSLSVDLYKSFEDIERTLLSKYSRYKIYFLHGYPSSIYEFAKYCEKNTALKVLLNKNLKGVFFSSEYPFDYMREFIENTFVVKSQAFYGHTERCVMAFESSRNYYKVLQTYGFAEVIDGTLIGTSYNSLGTPLIRYDTEDEISNFRTNEDILETFSLVSGRSGDYVYDNKNVKLSLTGLLFGRHHKLFEKVDTIQVCQERIGCLNILYTTSDLVSPDEARALFDSSNVDIYFSFTEISAPIKTKSGKFKVKVNPDNFNI
ncbi:hypothetical protein AB4228_07320 [Vibrio breoganii]